MRPVRTAGLLCALALTLGVTSVVVPGVAGADLVGQTITADLNNDGLPDHATLGQIGTTSTCTVTVALGTAPATFGAPNVHQYTSLETTAPLCPNIGAAVKLGTDKRPDLVTGFSFGFQDLMVLHKYQPIAIYPGVIQPDFIRSADLDGDGHADIIEGSNQVTSIEGLHANADGSIGSSVLFACSNHPQYVLGDFNGDHDDLAVDHAAWWQRGPQQVDQFGKVPGQRPVVAGAEFDLGAVPERDAAETVPLGFVGQAGGARHFVHGLGQHRSHRRHHGEIHGTTVGPGHDTHPVKTAGHRVSTDRSAFGVPDYSTNPLVV
jgi:hypothetical protein